jgi:hypothetical protein
MFKVHNYYIHGNISGNGCSFWIRKYWEGVCLVNRTVYTSLPPVNTRKIVKFIKMTKTFKKKMLHEMNTITINTAWPSAV